MPALPGTTYVPLVGRPITVRELSIQVAQPRAASTRSASANEPRSTTLNDVEYAHLPSYRTAVARGVYTHWPFSARTSATSHNERGPSSCPTC